MLLGLTLNILNSAFNFDDVDGLIYSLIIIIIAGAESAIGRIQLVGFVKKMV